MQYTHITKKRKKKRCNLAAVEERARLRGQLRGKKVLQMGGGGAGHSYAAGGGSTSSGW